MRETDKMLEAARNEQDRAQWFAVQTRHQHEKRIAERLRFTEMETFLPLHRAVHHWKNGVHADVELPLFPCYLFTRIKTSQRLRLLREPGIISIAASNSSPTPIPDEDICRLRLLADSVKAEPHPYLAIGERVKIITGPLAGMEGILVRKKHELRVVISIEIIMRSITLEVSEFEIEPVRHRRTVPAHA
jgi:transcription antitermination factor NusG